MTYAVKNYDRLLGIRGFSDKMMKAHFKLYEGYVVHVNKMIGFLEGADTQSQEYDEVKRRFAWEFNGMRLHEAYFGNMTKETSDLSPRSDLGKMITESFGSLEAWEKDFRVVSNMRGIGWALLAWDPEGKKLFNVWINEHDAGHLVSSVSLLVNDVFEHAYLTDYGSERKDYIQAFVRVIDWAEVQRRFAATVELSNAAAQSFHGALAP